jgi:RimJ/RimL family protein N-acetyltransferase
VTRSVHLHDGTTLTIRSAKAGDEAGLEALFASLPVDDRYKRFFSGYQPNERFLHRLATANEAGACQLVALVGGDDHGGEIVGEASAWPLTNGNGELGITVAPARRGWLGPFLLDALLAEAADRGFANVEADVLVTNAHMLALLRARGFALAAHRDYQTLRMVISTSGRVPTWPTNDQRSRVLIESAGSRSHDVEEAAALGLQVLVCPGPAARPGGSCPALAGLPCPLASGADAIVLELPAGGAAEGLAAAHGELHPGVPVCVHPPGDRVRGGGSAQLFERIASAGYRAERAPR